MEPWVCSAGYGLACHEAPLKPHSATFASGKLPTAAPAPAHSWWGALGDWGGAGRRGVRSIVSAGHLPIRHPAPCWSSQRATSRLAETMYWRPSTDLAVRANSGIVSVGTKADDSLGPFLLPCDARLQTALGGTRQAPSISGSPPTCFRAESPNTPICPTCWKSCSLEQPALTRYERRPATDSEVRAYIRARLGQDARSDAHSTAPGVPPQQSSLASRVDLLPYSAQRRDLSDDRQDRSDHPSGTALPTEP